MAHPPKVFISATSGDLATARAAIKEALLTMGCHPVEQTNFPPDYRTVREMLRDKIAGCQAVIHVVGIRYGAEPDPQQLPPGTPRRSYTQLEYDLALELRKKLYTFVCPADFPYDPLGGEVDEKRRLQEEHRREVQHGERLFTSVEDRSALAERVRELHFELQSLKAEVDRDKRRIFVATVLVVAALVPLAGGGWWGYGKLQQTQRDSERAIVKAVADQFTQLQTQSGEQKLTEDELFDRAVTAVADREQIPEAELREGIDKFVQAVKAGRGTDFLDRALAAFAERNFAAASHNAALAAEDAKAQRLAAEQLATRSDDSARSAIKREQTARSLQGQSLLAERRYSEAVDAFSAVLAVSSRAEHPALWADLQIKLGLTWHEWASMSMGIDRTVRRRRAIAAYRAAQEVYTRDDQPEYWAVVQNGVALALCGQALAVDGPERARLLNEAMVTCHAALEVNTRDSYPQYWANTQNIRATVLRAQELEADNYESEKLINDTVAIYRAMLEVRTRDAQPIEWAVTQYYLAEMLRYQASTAYFPDRRRLLGETVEAYRATLEIFTRDAEPQRWATTQIILGDSLREQAQAVDGPERAIISGEAAAAYRAALEVFTRDTEPQRWANAQSNLAEALSLQALAVEGAERAERLGQAVAACRAALGINTRDTNPYDRAMTQHIFAIMLRNQAQAAKGAERAKLASDSVAAFRAALEVLTRDTFPQEWAETQHNLALALYDQAEGTADQERIRLLEAAAIAMRAALEVSTFEAAPSFHMSRGSWLADVEAEILALGGTKIDEETTLSEDPK